MKKILLATSLAGVFAVSQSAAMETRSDGPSAETLAMLDPVRRAVALCSQRSGISTLDTRLKLATAMTMADAGSDVMPLFDDLPEFQLSADSESDMVRGYFTQGIMLTYGFNHHAAIRSFQAGQALEPDCAMCFWGEALALGPNINAPMMPEAVAPAVAALNRAVELRDNASPEGQALIDALAQRYSDAPDADRAALDLAYANAMLEVAARFPENDEIAVLAAEAAMDTSPWDYWEPGGQVSRGLVGDGLQLIETVLDRNLSHPQAAHLYIHLMENSGDPTRAEAAADRLAEWIAPSSGHLNHMPAHIYYRIGRYADSIRVNITATRADEDYLASVGDDGLYRFGYYPHNVHFIVTSAQMAGDMPTAIRESVRLQRVLSADIAAQMAWVQPIHAAPYMAAAQFATPERILEMREADSRLPYVVAIRHYARATAYAQLRDAEGFARELEALNTIRAEHDLSLMVEQGVPGPELLTLAEAVVRARFAYGNGNYDEAVTLYREAIALQDALPYTEPPYWYYPVDQSLGAALHQAGRHDEAKDAFMAALVRAPANGWALYGLAETERALGNEVEAAAADAALERVWLGSDNWLNMDRL
ncbi:hypothetical protein HFP51_05925 [Parasphingopyxis sp. CP4]|uniref:hypothetical protein n=1 Tax=Parasphingopyxis sp. CP4 TaxID=2724527 RepID=UPI00159FFDD0|nr:hypothetical protein [Parasphingopyxis sp. CP4]QLC21753.1 hypothetical protein HFP51_05925 [Parasphingopyxis sp. CP4]